VKLEEMATFPWLSSGDYEYVVSFVGEYPIDAQWKDNAHLEVDSPGLRQQEQAYIKAEPPKTSWKESAFLPSDLGMQRFWMNASRYAV
jgi:hypothetical protein